MKKTLFIKNALILTVSSLILRFAGIVFKIWLAQKIGSEGIGLYQLVFSVYVLASTFAISGISTAVTRLVSEESALGNQKGCRKVLRRAVELSLIIAFLSIVLLFSGAEFIGKTVLGDQRTVTALKILPFSLPFIGTTSCIRGYFIAKRKVTPGAVSQIIEQAVRIIFIILLVGKFYKNGLGATCFAVVLGDTIAEFSECFILYIAFINEKKQPESDNTAQTPVFKRILHISVPITSGRYLNSGLRTAENILVPKNLAKYAASSESALSQFGMIKGMALPILFFPSAILNAVSTLLIPEISEAVTLRRNLAVKSACERILKITTLVGIICGAVFAAAGREIGLLIYKSESVGKLLVALSPIVPLMYLDSICDGILKGLDQQNFIFKTSVFDSLSRIILILIILPKMGLWGFIIIMYYSNVLTCFLNVTRLVKLSKAEINIYKNLIVPIICAMLSTLMFKYLTLKIGFLNLFWYTVVFSSLSILLYLIFLFWLKIIKREDF